MLLSCVIGYLGTTNCVDITSVIKFDTRTCDQVLGMGITCVQGKCVCSAAGYVPDSTRTSCKQGTLTQVIISIVGILVVIGRKIVKVLLLLLKKC